MFKRALAVLLFAASLAACATPSSPTAGWTTTWSAPADSPGPMLQPQTLRQVVRAGTGGSQVRIRISNLYGKAPLIVGAAHVAAHAGAGAIVPDSDRLLRFDGNTLATVSPGAVVLSDPVDFPVRPLQELAISLYLPVTVPIATVHGNGMQTAWLSPGGDTAAAPTLPAGRTDDSRYFVTGVEVLAGAPARTLVVVGDSVADGVGSADNRNERWPDLLAERLQRISEPAAGQDAALAHIGIANAGIAGNRILNDAAKPFVGPSVLARFGRDALSEPGVRWILLHEGINDIAAAQFLKSPQDRVTAEQIVAGMQALAARAHAQGVRIWIGTLLPFEGTRGFYSEAAEAQRQAVNAWIRSSGNRSNSGSGGGFDAVVDFDAALRDPAHPGRLLPAYDSGDHLHPNTAGYRVMAARIDPELLRAIQH